MTVVLIKYIVLILYICIYFKNISFYRVIIGFYTKFTILVIKKCYIYIYIYIYIYNFDKQKSYFNEFFGYFKMS
jgi:hypothetical protein